MGHKVFAVIAHAAAAPGLAVDDLQIARGFGSVDRALFSRYPGFSYRYRDSGVELGYNF